MLNTRHTVTQSERHNNSTCSFNVRMMYEYHDLKTTEPHKLAIRLGVKALMLNTRHTVTQYEEQRLAIVHVHTNVRVHYGMWI